MSKKNYKKNIASEKNDEIIDNPEVNFEETITEEEKSDILLAGLADDDQLQYPLPEELIGDDNEIESVSDNPLIYGEFETKSSEEPIIEVIPEPVVEKLIVPEPEKIKPAVQVKTRTVADLNSNELRIYRRTGIIPK